MHMIPGIIILLMYRIGFWISSATYECVRMIDLSVLTNLSGVVT